MNHNTQAATLERALNVGNPDYRQDPRRPLPETTCG